MMKQEILHLATTQMKEGGYDALNFRTISEELGVTKANIHHHFQNKETLANEVVREYSKQTMDAFRSIAEECDGDLKVFLRREESFFWEMSEEAGHCGVCVCEQIIRVPHSPDSLLQTAQEYSALFLDVLESVVSRAAERGLLRPGVNPQDCAFQLAMMMKGLVSMAQGYPSVPEAREALSGKLLSWADRISL